jgi:hypothetical protein
LLGHGLEVPLVESLVTGAVGLDVPGCHGSSRSFLVASSLPPAPGVITWLAIGCL